MKGGYTHNEENRIAIQDIVCLPPAPIGDEDIPKGEYKNAAAVEATQIDRIVTTLEKLISLAAEEHVAKNCNEDRQLRSECKNNITRLLTSEFLFYTLKPLTTQEFSQLQNDIAALAAKQPENLHLVLGSFAVWTVQSEVMSVVPYIQCGPIVNIDLIVKNYFATGDPTYYTQAENKEDTVFKNIQIQVKQERVGKNDKNDKIKGEKAIILGKKYDFSFNNVLTCKTAGGARFFSCIDICLDHQRRIAKTRFENKLAKKLNNPLERKAFPMQCSHLLISNTSNVLPSKGLVDKITHVDPFYAHKTLEENSEKPPLELNPSFGSPLKVYITKPMACQLLQESELTKKIETHNKKVESSLLGKLWKSKSPKTTSALLRPTGSSKSSISAEVVSREEHILPSPLLTKLKDAKSALEEERAVPNEEDKAAADFGISSPPLVQFTQKDILENKASHDAKEQKEPSKEEPLKTTPGQ